MSTPVLPADTARCAGTYRDECSIILPLRSILDRLKVQLVANHNV